MNKLTLFTLKNIKTFNNLFFNLIIKNINTFNYIKIVMKYYSYFRFNLEYFKAFRFYKIFKAFFKFLALINILLAIFTLVVFTDFNYDAYKTFIEVNLFNLSFKELFYKIKNQLKGIFTKLINLFDKNNEEINDNPNNSEIKNNTNIEGSHKLPLKDYLPSYPYPWGGDSYIPYYIITAAITIVICFKYPDYTIYPIISGVSAFISSLFGDGSNSTPDPKGGSSTLDDDLDSPIKKKAPFDSKGKQRDISVNIDNLSSRNSSGPSSTTSSRSVIRDYFSGFIGRTVSTIHEDNPFINSDKEWENDSDKSSDSSNSSSSTIKENQPHPINTSVLDQYSWGNKDLNSPSTSSSSSPSTSSSSSPSDLNEKIK